jgi:hypothetical protein
MRRKLLAGEDRKDAAQEHKRGTSVKPADEAQELESCMVLKSNGMVFPA